MTVTHWTNIRTHKNIDMLWQLNSQMTEMGEMRKSDDRKQRILQGQSRQGKFDDQKWPEKLGKSDDWKLGLCLVGRIYIQWHKNIQYLIYRS